MGGRGAGRVARAAAGRVGEEVDLAAVAARPVAVGPARHAHRVGAAPGHAGAARGAEAAAGVGGVGAGDVGLEGGARREREERGEGERRGPHPAGRSPVGAGLRVTPRYTRSTSITPVKETSGTVSPSPASRISHTPSARREWTSMRRSCCETST